MLLTMFQKKIKSELDEIMDCCLREIEERGEFYLYSCEDNKPCSYLDGVCYALNAIADKAGVPHVTKREYCKWVSCNILDAEQYRSRILTGSIGLEGSWDNWQDGRPDRCASNRQYQYRKQS